MTTRKKKATGVRAVKAWAIVDKNTGEIVRCYSLDDRESARRVARAWSIPERIRMTIPVLITPLKSTRSKP